MCRVLRTEHYAPCPMSHASNLMSQALRTEHHAPWAMHACKSSLVLKISPKLASGLVPRYGPLIVPCLVKCLQLDFRIIKRFIICFLNNELNDNDYYYLYYYFVLYSNLAYKTQLLAFFVISQKRQIWYYIFIPTN